MMPNVVTRFVCTLVLVLLAACGSDEATDHETMADAAASDVTDPTDARDGDSADGGDDASDTNGVDADAEGDGGTAEDATDGDVDAASDTDAETFCERCSLNYCPDVETCEGAGSLELGVPLTDQDSSIHSELGDCAVSASGAGGPNLYYTLTLPAGQSVRLVAAPTDTSHDAVMRVLSDCRATKAENSARGGSLTDGKATLCMDNDDATDRNVIVAVGRYSGEAQNLALEFDLSAEINDSPGCSL